MPATTEILGRGWVLMKMSLAEQVRCSFGGDGWVFKQLIGFRLRGTIAVSPIALYCAVDS